MQTSGRSGERGSACSPKMRPVNALMPVSLAVPCVVGRAGWRGLDLSIPRPQIGWALGTRQQVRPQVAIFLRAGLVMKSREPGILQNAFSLYVPDAC